MRGVIAQVDQNVENLGADDSAENDKNAEIPGFFRIDTLPLRIANADPESEKHTQSHEKSVGGHAEVADMKKSREHYLLDA